MPAAANAVENASPLRRYFVLLYCALCVLLTFFWPQVTIEGRIAWIYVVLSTLAYAGAYLLLAALPVGLLSLLPRRLPGRSGWLAGAAALGGSLVLLAVYADYRLFSLYQFHFNGFVWNLLTTPGGIAALGATASTERTVAAQVGGIVLGNLAVLWLLHRYRERGWQFSGRLLRVAAVSLFCLLAGVEMGFAYSVHTAQENIMAAAEAVPFHLKSRATVLFTRLGFEQPRGVRNLRLAGGEVVYPGHPVDSSGFRPENVIVLVAESFRWDLLDPQITPNLWRFAQRSTRYERHYSGGNRTRMGLFSLFYGIYAPYWYSFEQQWVEPVLMKILREHNYQIVAHTSQSFTYPEFDHTIFAKVPPENLHAIQESESWQSDILNIDELKRHIDQRDPKRPFFGFMFFESTHAPYRFPEEGALRSDYLRDMNYIDLDLKNNIEAIRARYINAAHHVDAQIGRLIEHLERTGMLDKTVLLFTGDHGEEFMEKGGWGHGRRGSFPEEQIRVPLILWRPGVAPAVVSHRTSHLQVASTLLVRLGVTQDPRTYSSALPLDREMPYFVFGEHDHMGVDDGTHKIVFPYTGRNYFRYSVYDENDRIVTRQQRDAIVANAQPLLTEIVKESRRFVREAGRP